MCEQALFYAEGRRALERYAGEYILLQDQQVRGHSPEGTINVSRRDLAGERPDHALWFKFVDPDETEGEQYAIYEQALARMTA